MLSLESAEGQGGKALTDAELKELAYFDRLGDDQIVRLDERDKARFRGLILGFMSSKDRCLST
jgi:hypothetical protein